MKTYKTPFMKPVMLKMAGIIASSPDNFKASDESNKNSNEIYTEESASNKLNWGLSNG
ncbi:MAG: hypothetical protein Q4E68_02340 [Prevotellaceae bacterium]|nr:hypothetical protein [Prevotellaceae bacterium]